ncbi:hypothetical protein GCM10025867_46860 (plasmid) [Frondihabitans sucicola]|uniref:DUF3883 domain-containing protein n=1 Tax=Frondihabitans sucicola TaxID=1268041 RepID=A0ABN6Y8Z5_9MICO|nr:hypothetical protein [Frondihabitans sucicola]BDZ52445.1 hypothetical protein GCM10025867_46860 [Frondihabitans sucicola]
MARQSRPPMEPSAAMLPGQAGTRADYVDDDTFAARAQQREDRRIADEVYAEELPQRSADAARTTPRTIEDAANPRMSRELPGADELRKRPTSRRKKDLAKNKGEWLRALPKTRFGAIRVATENHQKLEQVNEYLAAVAGDSQSDSLPAPVKRQIRQLDLAIQDQERTNQREHIVYAPAFSPFEAGSSREAYLRRIQDTIDNNGTMDFDRYIVGDHSMSNLESEYKAEIAFEIKTRSGAYLGSSDTKPDALHMLPRGRVLQPVAILRDVPYVREDGSTGYWNRVVQFEDVTN